MSLSSSSQHELLTHVPKIRPVSVQAGIEYARDGRVSELHFEPDTGLLTGKVNGNSTYRSTAKLILLDDGTWTCSVGICSCPVRQDCKHIAALIYAAEENPVIGRELGAIAAVEESATENYWESGQKNVPQEANSRWEEALSLLLPQRAAPTPQFGTPLGLMFELADPEPVFSYTGRSGSTASSRRAARPASQAQEGPILRARPVVKGAKGKWLRTGIAWNNLNYLNFGRKYDEAPLEWLIEFLAAHSGQQRQVQAPAQWLDINSFAGRNFFSLLRSAHQSGITLMHSGASGESVWVASDPAAVELELHRSDSGGLDVVPSVEVGGRAVDPSTLGIVGNPAHGLFIRGGTGTDSSNSTADVGLTLVPLDESTSAQLLSFATAGRAVHVPAADENRFLTQFYPRLRQNAKVVAADESVELPSYGAPTLSLLANYGKDHRLDLHWEWHYTSGTKEVSLPLRAEDTDPGYRDESAEQRILDSMGPLWNTVPGLAETPNGVWGEPRLSPTATLKGLDTMEFTERVLPGLKMVDGLEVDVAGEVADYREPEEAPVVKVSTLPTQDGDWFDLGIIITLEGESVSFAAVFSALAAGHTRMLLPSGAHFSLDLPELHQLKDLIDEARALHDLGPDKLQISRFQAGLWEEFERLGIADQQAAQWRAAVSGLLRGGPQEPLPSPEGLNATLRPYQLEGFNWLRFLYDHQLGGILADDMGLGKTLQTLALLCSLKNDSKLKNDAGTTGSRDLPVGLNPAQRSAPFLVVAPTSVVGNWEAEATRFAPGLKTVAVSETFARSGENARELFDGVDLVITSYALFRIDYDSYAAGEWSALVLDEAQFVKNHQSKAYQCARKLPAPFKLAISGTPLENNLMELWSLTSIVAPGLFSSPKRFAEYYQKPIERGGSPALLEKLKSRIRPLMLRRTKEQVVQELPPKQEQILEVALNPRHQKVYQTHLQRERQKILGLLQDMNKNRFTIFQSLTLLRQLSLDVTLVDPALSAVRSSKLDVLFEQLEDVISEGHRALIFSQFTGFLGKVRERLDEQGIQYAYLDGGTRNRASVLKEFKEGDAPLFLISLKAGGFGLNLTEADYVFILDPWWNPASEAQAVDRTHRIGQEKRVMVYRLVAKDTIEEKVMALKAKKSQLFMDVTGGEELSGAALSADDLAGLFID
ncbi:SNF2-related protein [Pseudarthrobacter sp. J1738]|uniref:DEAD/DEAH box helicase n=1 Tax=Pseudarthrobacter sp. J1738 TaxID=3420446 RepID=UPI003D2E046A